MTDQSSVLGHPKPAPRQDPDETPYQRRRRKRREAMERAASKMLTARDITRCLRERHRGDILVTEVCCGRSGSWAGGMAGQGARTPRMDAVVIPRRWDRLVVTVYEIKVSRGDFLQDEKWPEYLPWCNRFLFATPRGLLTGEEKADLEGRGVGLVEVRPWGGRLTARQVIAPDCRPFPGGQIPWQLYHTIVLNKASFRNSGAASGEV